MLPRENRNGQDHSQDRKEETPEDRDPRQALPLRQVPQAKPQAGDHSRSLVLSELREAGRL